MPFSINDRILLLSPHPDDVEFQAGGILKQLQHHNVTYACCTEFPSNVMDEMKECVKMMDAEHKQFHCAPRILHKHQQRLLDWMIQELGQDFDLVLCPSKYDTHQDHQAVYECALRAYKRSSILSYISLWNQSSQSPNYFVEMNQEALNYKLKLIDKYKSQSHRHYSSSEYIVGRAMFYGAMIDVPMAEAFEVVRIVE